MEKRETFTDMCERSSFSFNALFKKRRVKRKEYAAQHKSTLCVKIVCNCLDENEESGRREKDSETDVHQTTG